MSTDADAAIYETNDGLSDRYGGRLFRNAQISVLVSLRAQTALPIPMRAFANQGQGVLTMIGTGWPDGNNILSADEEAKRDRLKAKRALQKKKRRIRARSKLPKLKEDDRELRLVCSDCRKVQATPFRLVFLKKKPRCLECGGPLNLKGQA